jgi:hypothetical protein
VSTKVSTKPDLGRSPACWRTEKKMKLKILILVAVLSLSASGATVTVTMDEPEAVANTPINGVTIAKPGISFTFSNPGANLLFRNSASCGVQTFVFGPCITGPNATLTVTFSVPVSTFQFGLEVNSDLVPIAHMADVTLLNGATTVAVRPLASSLTDTFAEGQFAYDGALGPVTSIVISPTPTNTNFTNLLFDNLTVTVTPNLLATPAASPLTLALTAICLCGLTMLLLRKQRA